MSAIRKRINSTTLQKIVNQKRFSAFFGRLSSGRVPLKVLKRAINAYIRAYKIDMSQFDIDLSQVKTFNQFFTRPLKSGARTFSGSIASFSDGFLSAFGVIENNQLFQVKGSQYPLNDLLQESESFPHGSFATIYLSPADYHRVHLPFDATIQAIKHIPGKLYSVNKKTVSRIHHLYCRNERVVLSGISSFGKFHLVFVGAIVVGKIVLSFTGNDYIPDSTQSVNYSLSQGDELGYFELGSTVILVMESDILARIPYHPHQKIQLGNPLA
jgi:phosphatidylserine decarboxylase